MTTTKSEEKPVLSFGDVVLLCAENEELVKEFNRLYGCKLGEMKPRSPIEMMVYKACNYTPEPMMTEDDMGNFVSSSTIVCGRDCLQNVLFGLRNKL